MLSLGFFYFFVQDREGFLCNSPWQSWGSLCRDIIAWLICFCIQNFTLINLNSSFEPDTWWLVVIHVCRKNLTELNCLHKWMYARLPVFNDLFSVTSFFSLLLLELLPSFLKFFLNIQVGHFQQTNPKAVSKAEFKQPSATRFLYTFGLCSTLCGFPSCLWRLFT